MFSEAKVTEIYCLADNSAKNLQDIKKDTGASSASIRNTSASIWTICSLKGSLTIVSLNWRKKYYFLWPYSSRLYYLEHVLESALWILLPCVPAGTS